MIFSLFLAWRNYWPNKKYQSPVSLAFVRGIHRSPVDSPHKGPVTRKMGPFDDVIMLSLHDAHATVMNEINFFQVQFVNQAGSASRPTGATKFSKMKFNGKRPKMRVDWLEAILLRGTLEMNTMPWGRTCKQTFVISNIQSFLYKFSWTRFWFALFWLCY